MSILDRILNRTPELRSRRSIESPLVKISSESILDYFGVGRGGQIAVTEQSALGLPPVWAAVNFLSRSLASLPLHVYAESSTGKERQDGRVSALLNSAASDEVDAHTLRKWFWTRVFTGGRGLIYIERDGAGEPVNLFALNPDETTVTRTDFVTTYTHKPPNGKPKIYAAGDVIDVAFFMQADGLNHRGPISACKSRLAQYLAANGYGNKVFEKGGLPVATIEGPFASAEAMNRASADLAKASADAYNDGKPAIAIPAGHKLNPIGIDPQKMQMVEFQLFLIQEIARIWQIPPAMLQHLQDSTYSNVEQQDLQFVKHVILAWSRAFESQLDLKLFGRENGYLKVTRTRKRFYTSHNVDGLLRGDFASRMQGLATSVQTGVRTPNEARALENLPPLPEGDRLMMQGATVPISSQPVAPPAAPPAPVAPAPPVTE